MLKSKKLSYGVIIRIAFVCRVDNDLRRESPEEWKGRLGSGGGEGGSVRAKASSSEYSLLLLSPLFVSHPPLNFCSLLSLSLSLSY